MKKVISLSGGLDSTVMVYWLVDKYGAENVLPVTYFYGQKNGIEIKSARSTCEKLQLPYKCIDISFLGDLCKNVSSLSGSSTLDVPDAADVPKHLIPSTYIPYRNLIMLSVSMAYAESHDANAVYISSQLTDIHWDSQINFVDALNDVSILNIEKPIMVKAPFVEYNKIDEIKLGIKLGVPFEDTWSCYDPQEEYLLHPEKPCQVCTACVKRKEAFEQAGILDPAIHEGVVND
jgi:7-cyano-7-deazaguanine synthase